MNLLLMLLSQQAVSFVSHIKSQLIHPLMLVIEMRFMLLHDNIRATDDAMKMFFMEVYELFIKVCRYVF